MSKSERLPAAVDAGSAVSARIVRPRCSHRAQVERAFVWSWYRRTSTRVAWSDELVERDRSAVTASSHRDAHTHTLSLSLDSTRCCRHGSAWRHSLAVALRKHSHRCACHHSANDYILSRRRSHSLARMHVCIMLRIHGAAGCTTGCTASCILYRPFYHATLCWRRAQSVIYWLNVVSCYQCHGV